MPTRTSDGVLDLRFASIHHPLRHQSMRGRPPLKRRHCVMIASSQLSYAGGALTRSSVQSNRNIQSTAGSAYLQYRVAQLSNIRHPSSAELRHLSPALPSYQHPHHNESTLSSLATRRKAASLVSPLDHYATSSFPHAAPIMANPPNKYVDVRPNSGHLMFHSASFDYASLSLIRMLGPLYYH